MDHTVDEKAEVIPDSINNIFTVHVSNSTLLTSKSLLKWNERKPDFGRSGAKDSITVAAGHAAIVHARKHAWAGEFSKTWPSELENAAMPATMDVYDVARCVYGHARATVLEPFIRDRHRRYQIDHLKQVGHRELLASCVSARQDWEDALRELDMRGRALVTALARNRLPSSPDTLHLMVQYAYAKHAVLAIATCHKLRYDRDAVVDRAVSQAAELCPAFTTFVPLVHSGIPRAAFRVLPLSWKASVNSETFITNAFSGKDHGDGVCAGLETGRGPINSLLADELKHMEIVSVGLESESVKLDYAVIQQRRPRGFCNAYGELMAVDDDVLGWAGSVLELAQCEQRLRPSCDGRADTALVLRRKSVTLDLDSGSWKIGGRPCHILTDGKDSSIMASITPKSQREFQIICSSSDIGVRFTEKDGRPCVAEIIPKGLADQAGLKVGHTVVRIGEILVLSDGYDGAIKGIEAVISKQSTLKLYVDEVLPTSTLHVSMPQEFAITPTLTLILPSAAPVDVFMLAELARSKPRCDVTISRTSNGLRCAAKAHCEPGKPVKVVFNDTDFTLVQLSIFSLLLQPGV